MSEIRALMSTNKGDIHLTLFADDAPVTVANFANLARRGYYDGMSFHRVIENFMIQGGCPNGDGRGGPGYRFDDECSTARKHDRGGVLSMANSGPGTNGSQFFVTHEATPWLDGKHTVFGVIVGDSDQTVVNAIAQGDRIEKLTVEGDVEALLSTHGDQITQWNKVLDG